MELTIQCDNPDDRHVHGLLCLSIINCCSVIILCVYVLLGKWVGTCPQGMFLRIPRPPRVVYHIRGDLETRHLSVRWIGFGTCLRPWYVLPKTFGTA
jgi:hypothetical protein